MLTQYLTLPNLQTGLTIADDIYNSAAQLIVPKGVTITDKVIDKLAFYSIDSVCVYVQEKKEKRIVEQSISLTHSQRVRESAEFLEYSEKFYKANETFTYELNDIANRNISIDVDKLFDSATDILSSTTTSFHVFDMLHNMRNFDDLTYAHSLNVSIIANVVGKWLELNEDDLKVLTVAGLLHDVGKLLIPTHIITKPGKLTANEFHIIKKHPMLGYELLSKQKIDPRISQVALFHHEKCDGSGYPFGASSKDIPAMAKIITIVDIYEAMTADRIYRQGVCPFEVIRLYEAEGFQKYDTRYIMTFLKGIIQTYLHETVQLSDGRIAEIIMINNNSLSNPIVKIDHEFIDLSKYPNLNILSIL